ncbi:3-oxoadipate enol-lactonase [Rhizobium halophytocola]|uniref:3-oxoadipate enol-lactonase n=1 Tax=Rhizobium halophytocola TaxID=735519 RepID=A0ABS4E170_9HYPH|nr:3-oxoadipate enol-lactonase [Rhizobium halophytocola]MBP1851681.1 3-oxoadipate enol-lactonase [Rhizobium halophytocola]
MAFAHINGIVVHYELLGDPDARNLIVFSNSLGTDFRIWLPVFDELADNVSVLVYDSRGHGLSGGADKPFGMDDLVEDLAGLVEHVGIKKAVFCGLSVGGLIVQGLYAKRPELVRKIVLCDTAPKIGVADTWNARIKAIRDNGMASIADGVMEKWFTPHFHEERDEDLDGYRVMFERQPASGYISTCEAIRDTDFSDILPTISVPTLLVVGDQDGSTPPELVRAASERIPGASLQVIEGCGHIPCVEQPEALAALIQQFIRKT